MPGDQRVALKSVAPVSSPESASGRVRTSLRRDLTAALKAQDRVAIATLRSALATADSEHIEGSVVGPGAAEAPRRQLTESDLRAIVETQVQQRLLAATGYEQVGRHDLAQRLRSEGDVLSRYLPPTR
jgi:uncharacterized protein YqeY